MLRRKHSEIKRQLLDQTAGIRYRQHLRRRGAVADQGQHGARTAALLPRRRLAEVLDAAAAVMTDALSQGGTSFDSLYGERQRGESGYFERSLDAYGREGAPCRRCGAVMRREKFMNRSSFYCRNVSLVPGADLTDHGMLGMPGASDMQIFRTIRFPCAGTTLPGPALLEMSTTALLPFTVILVIFCRPAGISGLRNVDGIQTADLVEQVTIRLAEIGQGFVEVAAARHHLIEEIPDLLLGRALRWTTATTPRWCGRPFESPLNAKMAMPPTRITTASTAPAIASHLPLPLLGGWGAG